MPPSSADLHRVAGRLGLFGQHRHLAYPPRALCQRPHHRHCPRLCTPSLDPTFANTCAFRRLVPQPYLGQDGVVSEPGQVLVNLWQDAQRRETVKYTIATQHPLPGCQLFCPAHRVHRQRCLDRPQSSLLCRRRLRCPRRIHRRQLANARTLARFLDRGRHDSSSHRHHRHWLL